MSRLARFFLFIEYFLTSGVKSAACVAGFTLLCWLFLTEYWLARPFPWWEGWWEYFFLVPALLLLILLAIYGVARTECRQPAIAPLAFDDHDPAPVAAWIAMLHEAARNCRSWILSGVLRWQAGLLERYGATTGSISLSQVPAVWQRNLRRLPALAWFPALLIFLVTPWASATMEAFSRILSDKPPEISRIKVSRRDARIGLIEEDLGKKDDGNEFDRQTPAKFPEGWLTISASDFPRVYRRVRAICGGGIPGCKVAGSPRDSGGIFTTLPLRAREAVFYFVTTTGALDLQMELTVFRRDGVTVITDATAH
jgi:hypothetical protein